MNRSTRSLRPFLCVSLSAGLLACASDPPAGQPVSPEVHEIGGEEVFRWWDNPGDVNGNLAAVGIAPRSANRGMSRTAAETDGRARLAAVLGAKIEQLVENWAQDTGDLSEPASMQSLMNNEAFTRQIVDMNISGSRVIKYHEDRESLYALVVLEDPSTFLDLVRNQVEAETLQDDTYFKTEVRKEDARKRLDARIEGEKEAIARKRREFPGPDLGG